LTDGKKECEEGNGVPSSKKNGKWWKGGEFKNGSSWAGKEKPRSGKKGGSTELHFIAS